MKLLDTVALIGYLNPKDKEHRRSREHVAKVSLEGSDVFVPSTTLLEADLLMKVKGYDHSEREISWRALESKILPSWVLPISVSSLYLALNFQERGLDYFDSLIASLAQETSSTVITTDKAIGSIVGTEW